MPTMCAGQTTNRRGSTAVLPHSRALNIVQRLCHRALTGLGLGLSVHQLYGYRVHYELRGEFGSHSFERRYPRYQPCKWACADMVRFSPGGLCEYMLMRECLAVYGSREYVGRYELLCVMALSLTTLATSSVWSPRAVLWLDEMRLGPWPSDDEDDGLPWRDIYSPWCGCTVTSLEGALSYFYGGINSIWIYVLSSY